jgi:murein DD-endopeptidase MepM/ murein hydrolase activator NlpD
MLATASAVDAKPKKRSAHELRSQLKSVKTQIRQKRAAIRQTRRQERHVAAEIDVVGSRITQVEGRLGSVRAQLRVLRARRSILLKRIDEAQERLTTRRRVLAARLRSSYESGRTSYLQVLLNSRSVNEYLSRSHYVRRIVESDVELMDGIRRDERQLVRDRQQVERDAADRQRLQTQLVADRAQYRVDVDHKSDLLHELRDDRQQMEEALDELEQSSHDIASRIQALQQTPQGKRRLAQRWTGSFIRPTSGPITSGYGMRFHPILHRDRMHTGVDIGAGYGTSIRAAAGGIVIMAGYMRGYGNTVIIDHGGGVSTLYGHCSSLSVSEGQSVRQGQTVARVGSSGLATGPHLHFEVRRNGSPVNPL